MNPVRPVGPIRAVAAPPHRRAHPIRPINNRRPLRRHLARRGGIARRHIHDRVVLEEITRPQQQRDRLDGHDGEILGRRDMRDAKGMPEHDVLVVDRLGAVADPLRETDGGVACRLGDVAARGPELVISV